MGIARQASRSNPKSQQKWQLNSTLELTKLKRQAFEKLADVKQAYNKKESAAANMANLGLVYKLDDKERSLVNYKNEWKLNEKLEKAEKPKPFTLSVPEGMGPRTEPVMMKEWDYDYYGPLVNTYGTNYKAMSRDLKRNYRQKSEGELRKMCQKYVEFRDFGENKLKEYEEEVKKQEAKERQGTILGAPAAIVDTNNTNADTKDTQVAKRKRADEAADAKDEKEKESKTPKKETATKANAKTKRGEDNSTDTKQTPAKKAKKEIEATPTPTTKTTKTKTTEQPKSATKPTKEVKAKEVKEVKEKKETKAAPATTKTNNKKEATKAAEKPNKKEVAKKGKKVEEEDDDDDIEGLEFDFDEDDLSDDE